MHIKPKKSRKHSESRKTKYTESPKNLRKITSYFTPSPKQQIDNSTGTKEKKSTQPHGSKIKLSKELFKRNSKTNSEMNKENNDKKASNSNSSSYKKYGVHVPSYEEILKQRKDYDEYIAKVSYLADLAVVNLPELQPLDLDSEDEQSTPLDCKALSDNEIVDAFHNNVIYLKKIRDGNTYCKRHEMFKDLQGRKRLTYNTSMIVFKNEHKQLLIRLLSKKFGNSLEDTDYYFKVLLPELCLKIFMDEYSMNYEEASKYLEERPVQM